MRKNLITTILAVPLISLLSACTTIYPDQIRIPDPSSTNHEFTDNNGERRKVFYTLFGGNQIVEFENKNNRIMRYISGPYALIQEEEVYQMIEAIEIVKNGKMKRTDWNNMYLETQGRASEQRRKHVKKIIDDLEAKNCALENEKMSK